jgi:hypothetical protein
LALGYAPAVSYYRAPPRPVARSRPWQLVVGAMLAMISGIAVLLLVTLSSVFSRSVVLLVIVYLPASVLVLAPVFMLMGYRWAYSFTVSGLLGLVLFAALSLVGSELLLLPVFVIVVVLVAMVLAPVWISLWLLLTRRVEQVFEGGRKQQLSVYYRSGEEEPYMQDPKEIQPHAVVYVPAVPYFAYGAYYPAYSAYRYGQTWSYGYPQYGSYVDTRSGAYLDTRYGTGYGVQVPGYYPGYTPSGPYGYGQARA